MDEHPAQRPEGKLLAEALERSGLSIRKASDRAGISYGRWRQIVSGYQTASAGTRATVIAPPRTLARMAAAVGITPGQLTQAGRADAARILAAEPGLLSRVPDENAAITHVRATPGVDDETRRGLIALVRGMRGRDQNDDAPEDAPPPPHGLTAEEAEAFEIFIEAVRRKSATGGGAC